MWLIIVVMFVVMVAILFHHYFIKDVLNRPQWIGPVYWITRDNGVNGTPHIQRHAFMRGTAPPWKISDSGLLVRMGSHTFQFGRCHNAPLNDPSDEIEGLEFVLNGPDVQA